MDILRILSRGTKQSNKTKSENASTKLPSAGTSANPQLYHDVIPESRGKKRKRGAAKTEENTGGQEEEGEALNFFAPKATAVKSKKNAPVEDEKPALDSSSTVEQVAPKGLDEAECRQILRSHRLKVTLLATGKPNDKKVRKSKKVKGDKKAQSAKEEHKQLYPQPLTTFGELKTTYGISRRMAENLADQGYKIPTEVQMGSLPLLLQPSTALGESASELGDANVDLLSIAPTGSGKTLAFLIPVVNGIIQRRRQNEDKGEHHLEAIIVAPTKELASQIVNEAKKLSIGTGVKVVGMRKGMRLTRSQDEVEKESSGESEEDSGDEAEEPCKGSSQPVSKADILVATPGLLLGSISTGSGDQHTPLPTVQTLVLDEADVLLDPLFRDQTLGIWNSCTNPELRVTLWSATMGSNIETLASSTITSRRSKLDLPTTSPIIRLVLSANSYTPRPPTPLLYAPPFLVFTQTIPRATALHSELLYDIPASAGGSSRIAVLHSSLSDTARSSIMSRFRAGEIWILITTDILSRGVDFRGVNGVVNYDVPNSGAAYIHRVGRTGRAGRGGGVAVTFYTKEDIAYVRDVANIIAASEKAAGKEVGEKQWLLDALPKPSKEEKKRLKMHGVEARRGGLEKGKGNEGKGNGNGRMQISTKSGYERRLEHNRKGAIQGSQRRAKEAGNAVGEEQVAGEESEWAGIDD
ncbi:ATP-dependent RNA helicase [Lachnellula hyalina]|uniref:ATP-dependent RNA helicase n=1 Tax=Lachnellula hyalina TaxID=1316788 RepID=A0A8H8QV78_9HELO|nr:ATP-dependent RNA helicase [Lachnellula hyalina]TVY23447.1 ATP-dependent RNA helicase [Lachnellula hyalina]